MPEAGLAEGASGRPRSLESLTLKVAAMNAALEDIRRSEAARAHQASMREYESWKVLIAALAAGAGIFVAGAAFAKFFG
ncbi:MAG: hypothetical protein KDG89_12220 [Geminicoccaceae bacterium]|nr:hypothetical protein [Geminicoccaceae bacterium]